MAATMQIESTRRLAGFYPRWVAANALAEMIGLGTSLLLWFWAGPQLEPALGVVPTALLVVLGSTLIEGTAVGLAQWVVLRRAAAPVARTAWWGATMLGAGIAWTLGMIPSTLMGRQAEMGAATIAEPPQGVVYLLAAGMGLLLGVLLGGAQWLALRRQVRRAGWWVPANALAWAAGMPLVFVAIDAVAESGSVALIVTGVLVGLLAAGAVVGAIHGAVMVRLLQQ